MRQSRVEERRSGRVHHLPLSPERLPAVAGRDLRRAFAAAREAALSGAAHPPRLFCFSGGEAEGAGPAEDRANILLFVDDASACAWIGGVERAFGLSSPYALALCFRLLALIDLLSRHPAAQRLCRREGRGGIALPERLFHAAAIMPLDSHGQFRESELLVED